MTTSTRKSKRKSAALGVRTVETLRPRESASESLGYGAGALEAQGKKTGVRWFFRYGKPQRRVALPDYNEQGAPLSLAEARDAARALSARFLRLREEGRDLLETLEAERLAEQQAREAERRAAESHDPDKPVTFAALMTAYADWLEERGKVDHRSVRTLLKNHISGPFPELAAKPANAVELGDLLVILQRIIAAKKLRTAAKARAYIRAAYAAAVGARLSAQASELRRFNIETNPAASVAAIEDSSRPRDRALSLSELRALWKRVENTDERIGPVLRFYLLTGGQRFDQLRRATRSDIHDDTLVLLDGKGRRTKPRRHDVPLLPEALDAVKAMNTPRLGDFVLSLTNGETAADGGAVRRAVAELSAQMLEAGEVEQRFTLSDLRRTIETRLAAEGVSSEIRAQLQSHGLGGVQARHYDRHDYRAEKLEALKKLHALMTEPPANVIEIGKAGKKRKRNAEA